MGEAQRHCIPSTDLSYNWKCDIFSSFIWFFFFIFILFFNFTILYRFCHISKWIPHRYTCVHHPEPSTLLPPCTIPLVRPSAPAPSIQYCALNLDWQLISYMIFYMFQCHSPNQIFHSYFTLIKRLFSSSSLFVIRVVSSVVVDISPEAYKRLTSAFKDICVHKVKWWKTIFHASRNQKRAGITILISDKIDFKSKTQTKDQVNI